MKTSGWVATIAAGVVLVGGGAWGATVLATGEPRTETIIDRMPVPTDTPTVEPSVTPTPKVTPTPEVTYTDADQVFLDWARPIYEFNRSDAPRLPEMSDQDLLDALHQACEVGGDESLGLSVIPGFDSADDLDPNTWEDDANAMFFGAARVGDGAGMSYCG